MARSSAAASKSTNPQQGTVRSSSRGALSREQRLELYYYMSDIVVALRKLAAY